MVEKEQDLWAAWFEYLGVCTLYSEGAGSVPASPPDERM